MEAEDLQGSTTVYKGLGVLGSRELRDVGVQEIWEMGLQMLAAAMRLAFRASVYIACSGSHLPALLQHE